MIHHITGPIVEKEPGRVVIEVGGIGLEIHVPDSTWNGLGLPGNDAHLRTHLAVREDAWTLFGFASEEERAVFRLLLGVQGVGPRLALAILSGVPVSGLRRAVGAGDITALTRVSGVGKKTAQRMIVDLKDKLGELPGGDGDDAFVDAAAEVVERDDVVDALVALGYPRPAAREAVRTARAAGGDPEEPVESILRHALQRL